MNKKIISIIIILLIAVVGITAYLNRGNVAEKEEAQRQAEIHFKEEGNQIKTLDLNLIEEQGEVTFNKDLDTSDSGPVEHSFTGVPLINILDEVGIDLKEKEQVIVNSVDGYTVALTVAEVLKEDNVYIIYKSDGHYLKTKKEGGSGPYRIVIKDDQFGQRWSKFVTEVNVK